ncbi:MAG TPA: hypothetical protein PLM63_02870 [bacterium]|jgi:hypothetical protein|nr:hypothetical protein [bacterium]
MISTAIQDNSVLNKKTTLFEAINNEEKLEKYINDLELDISASEKVDITISMLVENLLNSFSNFTDRRHLKASNIEALTNLLKLQADLPQQRVKAKKAALDILTKKRELEIKNTAANAVNNIAVNSGELLKAIFLKLDQQNIHPALEENEILEAECSEIIEKPKMLEESAESSKEEKSILELQTMLDSEDIGEDIDG